MSVLTLTPSTAGFSPDNIFVIKGSGASGIDDVPMSSAIAETLLNICRDMAALRVFMALLFEYSSKAEITDRR